MDRIEPSQTRSCHPSHSRADHYHGRRAPTRLGTRRICLLEQTCHDRRIGTALTRIQEFTKATYEAVAGRDDDPAERTGIIELLSHEDVEITSVGTGGEAWH